MVGCDGSSHGIFAPRAGNAAVIENACEIRTTFIFINTPSVWFCSSRRCSCGCSSLRVPGSSPTIKLVATRFLDPYPGVCTLMWNSNSTHLRRLVVASIFTNTIIVCSGGAVAAANSSGTNRNMKRKAQMHRSLNLRWDVHGHTTCYR